MKNIIHMNDIEKDNISKNIKNTSKYVKPIDKSKSRIKRNAKNISLEISWKNIKNGSISTCKVKTLKDFCIKNKLKRSGRKYELIERIHCFFKKNHACILIQKHFRGWLVRKYIYYKGCGNKDKNIINQEDFLSFELIEEIPFHQRYIYCEDDHYYYGFDIISILSLFEKQNFEPKNPYTRKYIPRSVYDDIYQHIRIAKILGFTIYTSISNNRVSLNNMDHYIINICSSINEHGYISDSMWFENLTFSQMKHYIRELYDLWVYRLGLSDYIKKQIIYPHGNPFDSISLRIIHTYTLDILKLKLYTIIDNFLHKGTTHDYKSLGCLYVLTALTLVSHQCALALPWLYNSAIY